MTIAKFLCLLVTMVAGVVWAGSSGGHSDPAGGIVLWATLILFFGIIGRYIAKRLGQPGVLGELLMGVMVGNACYFGGLQLMVILRDSSALFDVIQKMLDGVTIKHAVSAVIPDTNYAKELLVALSTSGGQEWIKITYVVDAFSRYGVIFLLFMVGLESSLEDLKKTGRESMQVAVIGVVVPVVLGILVMQCLLPKGEFSTALFVGATLSATSIGITARVFQDLKKLNTREARTILGAAMIDDILGLLILALVSGMVMSVHLDIFTMSRLIFFAVIFFPLTLWFGPLLLKKMIGWFSFSDPWEAKLLVSFIFVMFFSWLAALVQMSTIMGAFMAGMILNDGFFESRERELKNPLSIKNLLAPFETVFAPIFFMLVGIQVKLETFCDLKVMLFAACLIGVAVLGKLISGFGGNKRDDRLMIGIGMLPRGEVGLVFASVGKTIGVIPETLFSAIVVMIVVTTLITPLWLKSRFKISSKHDG